MDTAAKINWTREFPVASSLPCDGGWRLTCTHYVNSKRATNYWSKYIQLQAYIARRTETLPPRVIPIQLISHKGARTHRVNMYSIARNIPGKTRLWFVRPPLHRFMHILYTECTQQPPCSAHGKINIVHKPMVFTNQNYQELNYSRSSYSSNK